MKKITGLLFFCSSLLLSQVCMAHYGYHHDHVYVSVAIPAPRHVVVETAPPVELVEVGEPSPGLGYTWIKGRWEWDGQWEWKKGYWTARPHPTAVWISGGWEKREHHWGWRDGYWK